MALPFSPWPSLPYAVAGYGADAPIVDYYVRTFANGGRDVTGSGTPGRPYATPARALREAARANGRAVIHLGSGTYEAPLVKNVLGSVAFIGDGGGEPTDDGMIEVAGPLVADVGTDADGIAGAFAPGAFDAFTIEGLTGALQGQRRSIADTEAATLVPARRFEPAAAAGDTYRIVRPAVLWENLPREGVWIQNCGATEVLMNRQGISASRDPMIAAIYLCNLELGPSAAQAVVLSNSNVAAYGVLLTATNLRVAGGQLASGCEDDNAEARGLSALIPQTPTGQNTEFAWAGWGLSSLDLGGFLAEVYAGTFFGIAAAKVKAIAALNGRFTFLGGWVTALLADRLSYGYVGREQSPYARSEGTVGLDVARNSFVDVDVGAILVAQGPQDAIRAREGGSANVAGSITATSVTGTAVNCIGGGKVYLIGDPAAGTFTGGSAAFRVDAATTGVVGDFAAVGATVVSPSGDGSLVTRVV